MLPYGNGTPFAEAPFWCSAQGLAEAPRIRFFTSKSAIFAMNFGYFSKALDSKQALKYSATVLCGWFWDRL